MLGLSRDAPRTFAALVFSGLSAWCAAFLLDATFSVFNLGVDAPLQLGLGLGVGFLLVLCTGLIAVPVAALVVGLSRQGFSRLRAGLEARDEASGRESSARLIGTIVTLSIFAPLSFWIARECVLGIARPENMALAIASAHVVLALLGSLLRFVIFALTFLLLTRWAEKRGDDTPFDRPSFTSLVLLLLSAPVLFALFYRYRHLLVALPWRELFHVGAMILGALLVFVSYRGERARGWVVSGLSLALCASFTTSFFLRARDYVAIDLLERELKSASLLSGAFTKITDFDGDGHRGLLGGGDCRPHDPRFFPGAPDIPGNKLDEDCDGRDLGSGGGALLRGRSDYPVPAEVPSRFSIVFITVDAFAARHLKAFGYPRDTAPTLEKLIAEGTLFENCFAQGPSTRLSMPSLFVSRYDSMIPQELIGRYPYPLDARNLTLAEVLHGAGYRTTAVVPSSYFTRSQWLGLTQGFDVVDESAARGEPAFNADRVTDAAITQLSRKEPNKPTFLWVHYFDPHGPHKAPPDPKFPGTRAEDTYDSELAFTDQHLGRLIENARQTLGANTLFVVTGDHGYGFSGRRYARGGYGYDLNTLTLHVPLIVAGPFVPHARRKSLCSTMDVAPTLANLARVTRKLPFQGQSLLPELLHGQIARPQMLFHQFFLPEKLLRGKEPLNKVAVRTPSYNYVLDRESGKPSLWRWDRDYHERTDLVSERDADTQRLMSDLAKTLAEFIYASTRTESVTIHPSMLPTVKVDPKVPEKKAL